MPLSTSTHPSLELPAVVASVMVAPKSASAAARNSGKLGAALLV